MAAEDVETLIADLQAIPKEWRKEMRTAMREAAQSVVQDVRANASWSSRIPGAVTIRARTSRNPGVSIVVRAARAPHARPYEGISGAVFRHPLFGNRERWYAQAARPFVLPAVIANRARVTEAVGDAVDKAARRHGFTKS